MQKMLYLNELVFLTVIIT